MRNIKILALFVYCCSRLIAQDVKYTILYTGRTLGYARSPDSQSKVPWNPTVGLNSVALQYKNLFDGLAKGASGPILRLGMGDNFAPDLFARTFGPDPDLPQTPRDPKDRSDWDGKAWGPSIPTPAMKAGISWIPFDNVAQFFIDAGYNALVPGKHDFYFGAERLRDLARLLAAGGVHMLATNLVIVTQDPNANPRVPERLRSHEYLTEFGDVAIDLPDTVLPYKREFVIKNARRVLPSAGALLRMDQLPKTKDGVKYDYQIAEPQICRELSAITRSNPEDVPLPFPNQGNCAKLIPLDSVCPAAELTSRQAVCKSLFPPGGEPSSAKPTPDPTFVFEDENARLMPGRNHLFCTKLIRNKVVDAKFTCQPFMVHTPFFEYGEPIATQRAPERYVKVPSEKPSVVVFGVIDPDVFTNVGLLNFSWLNDSRQLDTIVKVAAPDYSLKQLLEQCHAEEACRGARKVLMAQMSYAKSAELISHLGDEFDVVISQADPKHFTADRTLNESGKANKFQPQIVLTPPAPYAFTESTPTSGDVTELPPATSFTPIVSEAVVTFTPPPVYPAATAPAIDSWKLEHKLSIGASYVEDRTCKAGPDRPCLSLSQMSNGVLIGSNIEPTPPAPGAPPGVAPKLSDFSCSNSLSPRCGRRRARTSRSFNNATCLTRNI